MHEQIPKAWVYAFFGVLAFLLAMHFVREWARRRLRQINDKTREKMVAIVSMENEFVEVQASEVRGLNAAKLEAYTQALTGLGFTHLLDYRLRRGGISELQGFARLFFHSKERCFAEVMAPGALRPDAPLFVAINSFMDSGWRLGTSNIPARKADYFMRLPRLLGMRYPDDPVEKLFSRHLERRAEILRDLEIEILDGSTAEFYFQKVREASSQRANSMQNANPIGNLPLAEAQATARSQEWMGDYPEEARRLREMKQPIA